MENTHYQLYSVQDIAFGGQFMKRLIMITLAGTLLSTGYCSIKLFQLCGNQRHLRNSSPFMFLPVSMWCHMFGFTAMTQIKFREQLCVLNFASDKAVSRTEIHAKNLWKAHKFLQWLVTEANSISLPTPSKVWTKSNRSPRALLQEKRERWGRVGLQQPKDIQNSMLQERGIQTSRTKNQQYLNPHIFHKLYPIFESLCLPQIVSLIFQNCCKKSLKASKGFSKRKIIANKCI